MQATSGAQTAEQIRKRLLANVERLRKPNARFDVLKAALLDLARAVDKEIPLIVGGGFGLYLPSGATLYFRRANPGTTTARTAIVFPRSVRRPPRETLRFHARQTEEAIELGSRQRPFRQDAPPVTCPANIPASCLTAQIQPLSHVLTAYIVPKLTAHLLLVPRPDNLIDKPLVGVLDHHVRLHPVLGMGNEACCVSGLRQTDARPLDGGFDGCPDEFDRWSRLHASVSKVNSRKNDDGQSCRNCDCRAACPDPFIRD